MKQYKEMTTVERATLFADLFRDALPQFLTYQKKVAREISEKAVPFITEWKNDILPASEWIAIAEKVLQVLEKYYGQLVLRPALFAEVLFDGKISLFTMYCLKQYCKEESNLSFLERRAIDFFFA